MCKKREIARICLVSMIALLAGDSLAHAELIAHWKLDDNAADATVAEEVTGMNGTMSVNTQNASDSGKVGTSLDFADTEYVTIDNPGPLLGVADFTVSAWVRNYGNASSSEQVLSWSDGTYGNRIQIELHENKMSTYSNQGSSAFGDVLVWDPDTWYHVAWTQSAGTMHMYRNGVPASGPLTGRPAPSSLPLNEVQIGSLISVHDFMGDIDDLQVYNEALSADQIGFLHANPGAPIPEPGSLLLLASGLIALLIWRRRK